MLEASASTLSTRRVMSLPSHQAKREIRDTFLQSQSLKPLQLSQTLKGCSVESPWILTKVSIKRMVETRRLKSGYLPDQKTSSRKVYTPVHVMDLSAGVLLQRQHSVSMLLQMLIDTLAELTSCNMATTTRGLEANKTVSACQTS